ncbi:signal transduction histidine kinase [Streptomyces umbrinus]|uniref:histidine kinase n=1 Tax=Streptomyces umbrinus TaxID=67370 RepID=A0ABU0SM79_9ACTN|nr:histidine kinase [Streptomyces umbrinus]MDQ1024666.1 signal transduction histidine kinase [Streptomyces umbrinus]
MSHQILLLGSWWRARDVLVRDTMFAVAMVALTLAPGAAHLGVAIGDLPVRQLDGWGVVLVGLLSVPLVLRRRNPAWCLTLVSGGFGAYELVGYIPTFATLGVYPALYAAGAYLERRRAWTAVSVTIGYFLLAVGLSHRGSPQHLGDYLVFFLALAACWVIGDLTRTQRCAEVARQQESVAVAMTQERARIARELLDITAQHVTAMVVQADAAQCLVSEAPNRVTVGLSAISESGRRALTDLRDLLAVMPAPELAVDRAPSPTLSQLAELVASTRAAGQPVELVEEGAPQRSSDGAELTAYWVAQESLANALKHAPGRRTVVGVHHLAEEVCIEVTTAPGPSGTGRRPAGTHGRGLMGCSERVSLYGGHLSARQLLDGTFQIRATIPRRM